VAREGRSRIVCGLAFTAILTGLTFVRFSRPRAKLIFAANPVIAMHHDKPTLMVRIGNGRAAVLTDAMARLNVLLSEIGVDGRVFRRRSCGSSECIFRSFLSFGL
jgi:inward rectifier potassium channel